MTDQQRGIGRRFWEAWKRVARRLADIQARVILLIFYFIILAPFALIVRLGSDSKRAKRGGWRVKTPRAAAELERALSQS